MHFYLFFYLFCLSSGVSGIILGILLYLKNRNRDILNYLAELLVWTVNIVTNFIQIYFFYIIGTKSAALVTGITISLYLTWALLNFFFPVLVFHFLRKNFSSLRKTIHFIIALFLVIPMSLINPGANLANILQILQIAVFYSVLFHTLFVMNKSIKKIANKDIKRLLKIIVYLQLFFYPLMFLEKTPFFMNYFPYGVGIAPAFYFLCNFLWLYFVSRYIYFPEIKIDEHLSELENYFRIYSLSKREQEIAALLAEGKSYKEIAGKLFISFETVKTHVNNIYNKSNVAGKIELVNLIKKCGN